MIWRSLVGGNSLRPTVCSRGRQRDVQVDTLDAYASSHALARLDLLKADVEGAELLLLEGAVPWPFGSTLVARGVIRA